MNILEARRRTLGKGVYKKTVEGNPAIAQGSLARRYPGITMQGWTEQAQYEGNQLFDKSGIVLTSAVQYISVNVGDGEFTLSTNYIAPSRNDVFFLPGNVNTGASSLRNGVQHGTSRTVTSENGYVTVALRLGSDGTTSPLDYQIMLNAGSTALPYEPYTGRKPSPSPDYPQEIVSAVKLNEETQKYEYEVKLTGANLWDATKAADNSNWVASTTQRGYFDFAIDVVPGQKITGSFPEKLPLGIQMYVGIVSIEDGNIVEWLYHPAAESLIVQQATITAITDKIWVRCNFGGIKIFVQDNPYFQIEYGSKRTDFQPYKEQTLTLTSDRPLTKWDKLEKRNGKWGWGYKSAEIESYTDESVPGEYFSTTGQLSTGAQVWYETTTETFVPLSESEQEQMNALHTFRPTTVLSNDCECEMTLTYKTKKSMQSAPGWGIRKPSEVTSYFTFGVKWNQINKIVLKASGITEGQNIFFCGEGAKQPWIGLYANKALVFLGIRNGTCNLTSDNILDGQFHEMIFTFEKPVRDTNISNIWDVSWSKNIIYHEIMFYDGEELLADYVPYYKGAGYMLDKKNNVVIRATNPDDYEFA